MFLHQSQHDSEAEAQITSHEASPKCHASALFVDDSSSQTCVGHYPIPFHVASYCILSVFYFTKFALSTKTQIPRERLFAVYQRIALKECVKWTSQSPCTSVQM